MYSHKDFDSIRPYNDSEVKDIFHELAKEPDFLQLIEFLYPEISSKTFLKMLFNIDSIYEFQNQVIAPYVKNVANTTATTLDGDNFESLEKDSSYFFISNHRDIILDSAFLNILRFRYGFSSTEIAIGDNLLIYPWITHLVRLNKSFIVNRNLPVRQMLEASKRLSAYIKHAMQEKGHSIWMAQREGRSKDANDRTHLGVLKMLNMSGEGNFVENMIDLNVVPLSISYEYDPCDFLKAREFLLKRDNPAYAKTAMDDLVSMGTGLKGHKGRIHFKVCEVLSERLGSLTSIVDKNQQVAAVAEMIDHQIHLNYVLYAGNYIAYDVFHDSKRFSKNYTRREKRVFLRYVKSQVSKIPEKRRNTEFLTRCILEMYANPLINQLEARRKEQEMETTI